MDTLEKVRGTRSTCAWTCACTCMRSCTYMRMHMCTHAQCRLAARCVSFYQTVCLSVCLLAPVWYSGTEIPFSYRGPRPSPSDGIRARSHRASMAVCLWASMAVCRCGNYAAPLSTVHRRQLRYQQGAGISPSTQKALDWSGCSHRPVCGTLEWLSIPPQLVMRQAASVP